MVRDLEGGRAMGVCGIESPPRKDRGVERPTRMHRPVSPCRPVVADRWVSHEVGGVERWEPPERSTGRRGAPPL